MANNDGYSRVTAPNPLPPQLLHCRQQGLALITALLVVALAVTAAAYLSIDQQIWLRQAQNLNERSQAEAVREAAFNWAIILLENDIKNTTNDHKDENWAKDIPPIPVEGGSVSGGFIGKLYDAQARFNINNIFYNGAPNPANIGIFQKLLSDQELDPNLSDAVLDWLDADEQQRPSGAEDSDYMQLPIPYRTAMQPLQSVDELRLIRGFTPKVMDKLLKFITVLPAPTQINVNTADVGVLKALFYVLQTSADIDALVKDVTDRQGGNSLPGNTNTQSNPFTEKSQISSLFAKYAKPNTTLNAETYDVKSSYFKGEVTVQFGRYLRTTQAIIYRQDKNNAPKILWHSQLLPR